MSNLLFIDKLQRYINSRTRTTILSSPPLPLPSPPPPPFSIQYDFHGSDLHDTYCGTHKGYTFDVYKQQTIFSTLPTLATPTLVSHSIYGSAGGGNRFSNTKHPAINNPSPLSAFCLFFARSCAISVAPPFQSS